MVKVKNTKGNYIARTVGFFRWKSIQCGKGFNGLNERQQQAILLHEFGHCDLGHMEQRLWWAITFRWLDMDWLKAACHKQEFEADEFSAKRGCKIPLMGFLTLCEEGDDSMWHPTIEERLSRLTNIVVK